MSPSQAADVLHVALNAQVATMIWGSPGIGKSDVVRQVCEETERDLIDVRISQLDSVDLRGIPNVIDGITHWNPPAFLPRGKDTRGVLFLDEINAGSISTMAAAYQLVLDRKLGEYSLPSGWVVVAAGNRIQDRSIVNAMPAALRNRFIHIDMESNVDDWSQWALVHDIEPDVLGFIRYTPTLLNEFDLGPDQGRIKEAAAKLKDARAFATPRSWTFLSRLLKAGIPPTAELATYGSVVGEAAASQFVAYLKYARKMPNLDAILLNPSGTEVPTEPATLYAVASGLALKITPDNFDRATTYLGRLPPEFGIMCVKDACTRNSAIIETKAFDVWATKNVGVIL